MANNQNTSTTNPVSFLRGMVKDIDDSQFPAGAWFHARNTINTTAEGNEGTLGNEPSNTFCQNTPFPIIGAIHLNQARWAIFSTNGLAGVLNKSEIGIFEEDLCSYIPIKNTSGNSMNQTNCLNFQLTNLVIGVSKENFDCTWQVYWADALNPDRTINIDNPAFIENQTIVNNCVTLVPTTLLDCDKLQLAPLVNTPCLSVSRGPNGGNILNGSYYAIAAYVLNSQRVTDYFIPSDIQAIFEHDNLSGSLIVTTSNMDINHFDYFELVIVRTTNGQTSAKRMGIYSTRQPQIFIDSIPESLQDIPVEFIPIRTPSYDRSDGVFEIGNYMLRTGPRAKFDFNYQPLANRITAKWQAVAQPSNYYGKGGHNTGYLRDEVYSFFIRWIYNTGVRSSSYHIPGRPSLSSDLVPNASANNIPVDANPNNYFWDIYNTATLTAGSINGTGIAPPLSDGGILIAEGNMGYWESTEIYPDTKPDIFNASAHSWSTLGSVPAQYSGPGTSLAQFDLCGQPIRHHKFPENVLIPHFRPDPTIPVPPNILPILPIPIELQIIVLGVAFDNILPPVDNNGVLIPGIVGYEILRGSREGNKTVIAKGILNNMRTYSLDNSTTQVGLYQNYPYNPLGTDPSLVIAENIGELSNKPTASGVSPHQFTFHSPDTQFNNPFLSSRELKLYGELSGNVIGNFDESPKHPKEKLITDVAFFVAAIIGIGAATLSLKGKKTSHYTQPQVDKNADHGLETTPGGGLWGINDVVGLGALGLAQTAFYLVYTPGTGAYDLAENSIFNLLATIPTGIDPALTTYRGVLSGLGLVPGTSDPVKVDQIELSDYGYIPSEVKILNSFVLFSNYWTMGTQAAIELIEASVPYTQYAMRYTSHGFMNNYTPTALSTFRYEIDNAIYLNDGLQEFGKNSNAKINNINRGKCVALETVGPILNPTSAVDNTVQTIGSSISLRPPKNLLASNYAPVNVKTAFPTQAVSHYGALKNRMRNQYGQIDSIVQVPVSTCIIDTIGNPSPYDSGTLFNGDTYIGRYTEKNTFFYFWDWLYDQPNGYEFNYQLRYMLNFPRYWANFDKYDISEFLSLLVSWVGSGFTGTPPFPDNRHSLDGPIIPFSNPLSLFIAIFRISERYFYLFNSGIRDFFVESEINVDMRDWGDLLGQRHYDPYRYTDVKALFDVPIIKSGNFFKYDQSLSMSRVFNNFFSWGNVQSRDYDPIVAETCYTYYKNRVIYSLPQNLEAKKDYWRVFLASNYKDFKSRITAVEPVNKSGAMFFFQNQAPVQYQGVDVMTTELGTKITIGDGGLFSQPEQSVVNSDVSYEYGSCQNRLSVANTPVGLFWISENQGKIFRYGGQIKELSAINMKFWFSMYLPYQLTKDFPNFDLLDNPVAGIGCQSSFNNRDTLLYFAKKDFRLKKNLPVTVTYHPQGSANPGFFAGIVPIKLGDPTYFDDASWTLSFDPKNETWQSFHDWHPDFILPSKRDPITIVKDVAGTGSLWKHTISQLSFCNFYNQDFPFTVEYVETTGQTVNVLRSLEYFMEALIFATDTEDFYQVLDYNFDHAIIYNSEQVSGMLILNNTPNNNPAAELLYPKINPNSIDILYSKVEQKYRFNSFFDITADRGEFTYPTVQRPIWITQPNGYIRDLNPGNLNYNKAQFERKRFRQCAQHIMLTRNINKNIKMILRLVNNKNLVSLR